LKNDEKIGARQGVMNSTAYFKISTELGDSNTKTLMGTRKYIFNKCIALYTFTKKELKNDRLKVYVLF
jgi:hypothetical protein